MSGRIFNKLAAVSALLLCVTFAYAEDDTGSYSGYSPYSIFGIGDISMQGTAYNRSMGGVGIASRNSRFINIMNPAAVSARDTLTFMVDFAITGENRFMKQNSGTRTLKSVNNTFNMANCIMSFPIWRSLSMMVGVLPYSSTGYGYSFDETDQTVIANVGNISYANSGQGGVYQGFATLGFTLWKRLSFGAQAIYYFGNVLKQNSVTYSSASCVGVSTSDRMNINAWSGKFGVQYMQPMGDNFRLGLGATYRLGTDIWNTITKSGVESEGDKIKFAAEMGFGLSLNYINKLRFEVDYIRADWTKSGFESSYFCSVNSTALPFKSSVAQSIRAGVEYVPNSRDTRYYLKHVAYRAGCYYNKEYLNVGGNQIDAKGLTIGATFPIVNGFCGLTTAFELGQKGTLQNNLVKETYFNISIGMSLYDIWFRRMQYN